MNRIISALENSQTILTTQVDELYASLDVVNEFPQLHGISLKFLRTLLLARDLKMKIRTKAVGSFFEWERLDRAVGGRNIPLGKSIFQTLLVCNSLRDEAAPSDPECHHETQTRTPCIDTEIQRILQDPPEVCTPELPFTNPQTSSS